MKCCKKFTKFLAFAIFFCIAFSSCHSSKDSARWEDPIYAKRGGSQKSNTGKGSGALSRPVVNVGEARTRVIDAACDWLGVPYQYGGNSRSGVDCSGLVYMAFEKGAGIRLPRSSRDQQKHCKKVSRKKIKPGDLIFFTNNKGGGRINHVGIYIGEDKMIHSSSSRGVVISSLDEEYWVSHFHSCGKALD